MLSCKKIGIIIFAIAVALPSCMEHKILFSFKNDVNKNFFKDIPGIGGDTYLNQHITKMATNVQIYTSTFSEKNIENDNLLEFTELNDSTTIPFVTYKGVNGYSQNLYLLKYEFSYLVVSDDSSVSFENPVRAVIFFSIKHNGTYSPKYSIGITPCYFGIINEEDSLIAFDTELSLKKDNGHYYLKPAKRNKKLDGLFFMPADFPENPKTTKDKLTIKKIVRLDPNKIGGYKPLVFYIQEIFHDANALQFHYNGIIHLNQ
jgi:hypothetical protein